ncbi:MAG TPA: hypothetical protein VHW26_10315 [Solirubrobacteraceae bacterium]|jgi:hypothetical protein|nr:hypothetical protein [Solirubrobacteraceae bacterium]
MSVAVPLIELHDQVLRFGFHPYIVTVSGDFTPRVTSVRVSWEGTCLVAPAGRRTAAAIGANDTVALLWPSPAPGEYALIVDGVAEIQETAPDGLRVSIQPAKAVLHVTSWSRTAPA